MHILSVKGSVTHGTSCALQEAVSAVPAHGLILDLTEVPSVDSMAVGALVRVYVSCAKGGRKLAFVGLNHRVRNVLQIVGVDPLFIRNVRQHPRGGIRAELICFAAGNLRTRP